METGFVPVQMLMDELRHKSILRLHKPDPLVMLALVRQTRAVALANPVMVIGGFVYKRSPVTGEKAWGTIVRAPLARVADIIVEHGNDGRAAERRILDEFDDSKLCMEQDPHKGVCGRAAPCYYHQSEKGCHGSGVAEAKQTEAQRQADDAIEELIGAALGRDAYRAR